MMEGFARFFQSVFAASSGAGARRPQTRILRLEPLESRRFLAATVVVSQAAQAALVGALEEVDDGGTILFAENLRGATIAMTGAQIYIGKNVAIDAGDLGITIDANRQSRIFSVASGVDVTLNGLTLTGGYLNGVGGAIYNAGTLTMTNVALTDNFAGLCGGAIYNVGRLATRNATLSENTANVGGAIYSKGSASEATIEFSTLNDNSALAGGAIYNSLGKITIANSSMFGNAATGSGNVDGGGAIYNDGSASRLTIVNSTIVGNTAAKDSGAVYNYKGKIAITNSIATGNKAGNGVDIRVYDGECVANYSLLGNTIGSYSGYQSRINVRPGAVFRYSYGVIVRENGVPILAEGGDAFGTGTLVGRVGDEWYFVDKVAGAWRKPGECAASETPFDAAAPDFGLTGGEVFATALNFKAGAPVSRVASASALEFDVGAYAVPRAASIEGATIDVETPKVGDVVKATILPPNGTATYEWRRVSPSGAETTIAGATGAEYVATSSDVGFYLKVVATGVGDYVGTVCAQTSSAVVFPSGESFSISLSTPTPGYYETVRVSTTPASALKTASFQWYYVDPSGAETAIPDATQYYFKVKDGAVGKSLKVVATCSGTYVGSESATTSIVANPELTRAGLSMNAPSYDKTVSASLVPSLARSTATYQWYRVFDDGSESAIEGATEAYYKVKTSADFGCRLKVVATGGGVFVGSVSAETPYAVTASPLISLTLSNDSPAVGELLKVTRDPGAATCTFQWYRVDPATSKMTRIEGATYASYRATKADVGYQLKVYAWAEGNYRGSKAALTSSVVASNATDVALGELFG
ncbi:MAG: hypothetical protein HUK22_00900, partial [Thermoguttaceae bacterium]|nr:hypothetical protein [Thermoguttaceae bacterium]